MAPLDLVFVSGWISHVELAWELPAFERFLRRLGGFVRLIRLDKRGTGLSDPVPPDQLPSLEQRMDDIRAVLDAVGSERAALLGISEGGPPNLLFAATYPTRTAALVLFNTYARIAVADDYPGGVPRPLFEAALERLDERWGTGVMLGALAPSLADDPAGDAWARYQRMSASRQRWRSYA
jgi:pimeloyl-ACP methyl ester carboxylesterase